jgi:hypothetical protein
VTQDPTVTQNRYASALFYVFACCVFGVICIFVKRHVSILAGLSYFWDARVYLSALQRFGAGINPYVSSQFSFVYPPIVLAGLSLFSHVFPKGLGWYCYLTMHCILFLALPYVLSVGYIRAPWMSPTCAMILFTFQPALVSEYSLLSGNVSATLYTLVLAAGLVGLRRKRWLVFYITVALAASIKIPFLALLLLPLLAAEFQIVPSVLTAGVVVVGYGLQIWLMHDLYVKFHRAVVNQVITGHDVGFGIFGYLFHLGNQVPVLGGNAPYVGHLLIMGTICGGLFLLRHRNGKIASEGLWISTILVASILANPRIMIYDGAIVTVPAAYLCVEGIRQVLKIPSALGWIVPVLFALVTLMSVKARAGTFLFFMGSLALAMWILARAGRPCAVPALQG